MPDYLVQWEIEISADTPQEAARTARDYQTKPGTTAVVFDVYDENATVTRVDLMED